MQTILTQEEWQPIGSKLKELRKNNHDLLSLLMDSNLPKDSYEKRWGLAEKSLDRLHMHICKTYRKKFFSRPNKNDIVLFYDEEI